MGGHCSINQLHFTEEAGLTYKHNARKILVDNTHCSRLSAAVGDVFNLPIREADLAYAHNVRKM